MQTTQDAHGIANGHWEREESRSGWLLLLARMGIAELRAFGDFARAAAHAREGERSAKLGERASDAHTGSAVAAE